MTNKTDWLANIIKVAAILTAAPRWVGALLGAEGFMLPVDWLPWWVPVSAGLSAGMALVEGLAFAYVFEAWRNQQDKDGDNLLWFALISAAIFVGVLAPYIAASVTHKPLEQILSGGFALGAWSVAVGASTIAIVASVGYAQKRKGSTKPAQPKQSQTQANESQPGQVALRHICLECGYVAKSRDALNGHKRKHSHKAAIIADALEHTSNNGKTHEPVKEE